MALHKKLLSRVRYRRHRNQFRRQTVLQTPEAGQLIRSRIEAGVPLMVSRFSTCEINVLNAYRQRERSDFSRKLHHRLAGEPTDYTEKIRFQAHNNAGIFPETVEGLDHFAQITLQSCEQIDILGVWSQPLHQEQLLRDERCPSADLITLNTIEPYYSPEPWSAALAGKRVLVIHPFEASIRNQFEKRDRIFSSPDVLPEFELQTLRAVQSNAGGESGFTSWSGALASMQRQMDGIEFDVALIGAGAYGLPLAAHAKLQGKQAIHMGGALQLLFGIQGARWDDRPEVNCFYNEHWVRPLPEETPVQSGRVEEGCYW